MTKRMAGNTLIDTRLFVSALRTSTGRKNAVLF